MARLTGVCCSMISLTSTDHGVAVGWRHGRSRACAAYHSSTGSVKVIARHLMPNVPSVAAPRPLPAPLRLISPTRFRCTLAAWTNRNKTVSFRRLSGQSSDLWESLAGGLAAGLCSALERVASAGLLGESRATEHTFRMESIADSDHSKAENAALDPGAGLGARAFGVRPSGKVPWTAWAGFGGNWLAPPDSYWRRRFPFLPGRPPGLGMVPWGT